jgi:hypothetical protein
MEKEKEKTKISFLWFNLFYCITSGVLAFICLDMINMQRDYAVIIAIYIYTIDVNKNTTEDYLKYCIEKLEAEMNRKLILKQDADI